MTSGKSRANQNRARSFAHSRSPLRIVALGSSINGNTEVLCRAWHDLGNSFLLVGTGENSDHTAFKPLNAMERGEFFTCDEHTDREDLLERVRAFQPDAIICSGWNMLSSYRQVMKQTKPPVLRIMFMDTTWRSTARHWLGRGVHRFVIDPLFDVALVPGERTEFLARRLGFGPDDVIRGAYTADTPLFDSGPRSGEELASRRRFLFVGRLIAFKGLDVLAEAYRRYRDVALEPWELHIVGTGPEEQLFGGLKGVTTHGFVQPSEVAVIMHESSVLVLPSRWEHFGIVVHEAAAAGLPLLVSETAGAVPGLLQDGYNGWAVPDSDVAAWSSSLMRMLGQSPERLGEMSDVSRALSTRLSPAGWARNLHDEIQRRRTIVQTAGVRSGGSRRH